MADNSNVHATTAMPDKELDDFDDWWAEFSRESQALQRRRQQVGLSDLIYSGLITPPMDLEADYTPDENNPTRNTFG